MLWSFDSTATRDQEIMMIMPMPMPMPIPISISIPIAIRLMIRQSARTPIPSAGTAASTTNSRQPKFPLALRQVALLLQLLFRLQLQVPLQLRLLRKQTVTMPPMMPMWRLSCRAVPRQSAPALAADRPWHQRWRSCYLQRFGWCAVPVADRF